jgi:glutathione synthase/RimK-type ligase-like ATP-grasp enzyme
MPTFIYPYKGGSESVKGLKDSLNCKIIKLENSRFKPSPKKTLINWGSSSLPENYSSCKVLNDPKLINLCSNKLTFFKNFGDNKNVIDFTTDKKEVISALEKGHSVCVRHKLTGHSGEGLEIFTPNDLLNKELPDAPLYTVYKKKKHEFRLHVVNNKVIDIQRKALRTDDDRPEEPDFRIRSHANGFVFVRNEELDKGITDHISDIVLDLNQKIGLDFGAYDVIYNSKDKQGYILEVNTAPGLTGTTLENYVNAFKEMGL